MLICVRCSSPSSVTDDPDSDVTRDPRLTARPTRRRWPRSRAPSRRCDGGQPGHQVAAGRGGRRTGRSGCREASLSRRVGQPCHADAGLRAGSVRSQTAVGADRHDGRQRHGRRDIGQAPAARGIPRARCWTRTRRVGWNSAPTARPLRSRLPRASMVLIGSTPADRRIAQKPPFLRGGLVAGSRRGSGCEALGRLGRLWVVLGNVNGFQDICCRHCNEFPPCASFWLLKTKH